LLVLHVQHDGRVRSATERKKILSERPPLVASAEARAAVAAKTGLAEAKIF